jgi:hypothetical protein
METRAALTDQDGAASAVVSVHKGRLLAPLGMTLLELLTKVDQGLAIFGIVPL